MRHRCDNCGAIWNDDEIEEVIGDLSMRLTPGGVCPSGECRECGALVYPYGPQEEFVAKQGNHCPFCDSRNIMAHPVTSENFDSGRAWLSVECHDCGKLWDEQYKLVGFKEDKPMAPFDYKPEDIVRKVLDAMFDRLESCVPPCVSVEDTYECGFRPEGPNHWTDYVHGVLEMAATTLWLLSRAKGCGIGDIKVGFLEGPAYAFMIERLRHGDEHDGTLPDVTPLVGKFMVEYWLA